MERVYEVELEPWVLDEVRGLPREFQRPVVKRMAELGQDPRPRRHDKLEPDAYRVFQGPCGITYRVDDANRLVVVTRVSYNPFADA